MTATVNASDHMIETEVVLALMNATATRTLIASPTETTAPTPVMTAVTLEMTIATVEMSATHLEMIAIALTIATDDLTAAAFICVMMIVPLQVDTKNVNHRE